MRRLIFALALAPLSWAHAAEPDPAEVAPILPTLTEWAQRAVTDYTLDGLRPSRATIALLDQQTWHLEATLGALTADQGWRTRPGRVEVVVGDAAQDSSRFMSRDIDVLGRPRFVVDDHPLAVSRDLWLATDSSFKAAVQQLQVKQGALAGVHHTYPPTWSEAEPVISLDPSAPPPPDVDRLRRIAVEGSARLNALGGLRNGEVKANLSSGRYLLATSEGTQIVQPEGHVVIYAWADHVSADGVQIYEYAQWVAESAAELPPDEALISQIEALGKRVLARSEAEAVEYYEGPVVFEGDAAADVFRYLAVPELLGTPPQARAGSSYVRLMRDQSRLGRRLLAPGWSAIDDPTSVPDGLAGGFTYDREGVPAEAVHLVEDGWVHDLLMSRVPRHDRQVSNGHARGGIQGGWSARESMLRVRPDRLLSERRFDREVSRLRNQARTDRILVVRSLERSRGRSLPNPTDAVWRYADGREEPVLALNFTQKDRRILRDIVAAGGSLRARPYLAPLTPDGVAQGHTGIPAVIEAPERLLVTELEAVFPGGTVEPPIIPPPR